MIVASGLDSPYTLLQGYGVGAITLTVSPSVITSLVNATVTLTASVACTWSTDIGSLVVSGDHLSAVWTAPGVVGTGTITVTDESDPGNTVDVPAVVVAYFAGNFVLSGGAGTLVDNREPGAYSGGATAPAPPPPVLLPDLVAGWALTAGPQQTLDSTGVIASGALDLTGHNGLTYGANGALFTSAGNEYASVTSDLLEMQAPFYAHMITRPASNPLTEEIIFLWRGVLVPSASTCYQLETSGPASDKYQLFNDFVGTTQLDTNLTGAQFNSVEVAYLASGPTVKLAQNNAAWSVSTPWTLNPLVGATLDIGAAGDFTGTIDQYMRYVRIWIGANAAVIAGNDTYRTWLHNSGNGRTDAEVAAYTG